MRNHFQNNLYKIHLGKNGSQETLCARCGFLRFCAMWIIFWKLDVFGWGLPGARTALEELPPSTAKQYTPGAI